jgi:hypothetical protein
MDILDGLALWNAGFKNVIALYGTNGWTGDHEQHARLPHERSRMSFNVGPR